MYLEIVTPEASIFKAEVEAVTVPGVEGEFQMLENHAAIVSLLEKGTVKVKLKTANASQLKENLHADFYRYHGDDNILALDINSGTVECKDNKIIVLAD